jgi:hypothetical protein
MESNLRGHKVVYHDGELPGFRAQFSRFVDDHLTIIILMKKVTSRTPMAALNPSKPRCRSVTPAAIQIRVSSPREQN